MDRLLESETIASCLLCLQYLYDLIEKNLPNFTGGFFKGFGDIL